MEVFKFRRGRFDLFMLEEATPAAGATASTHVVVSGCTSLSPSPRMTDGGVMHA